MKVLEIVAIYVSAITVTEAAPLTGTNPEAITFDIVDLTCDISKSKRDHDYTAHSLGAFEFPEEDLASLGDYYRYNIGESKATPQNGPSEIVESEDILAVNSAETIIPEESSEVLVSHPTETPTHEKLTSQRIDPQNSDLPSMATRIKEYIFDNFWLDSSAIQDKIDSAKKYANKIYELFYGPPIDEETQKSKDINDAEVALESLWSAVLDVFRGNYSPRVRERLQKTASELVMKMHPLTFLACPQTEREKNFRRRLDKVRRYLKEADRRLDEPRKLYK